MKRKILSIVLVLILGLVQGCSTNHGNKETTESNEPEKKTETNQPDKTTETDKETEQPDKTPEVKSYKLADYYPSLDNIVYKYIGEGNEYAFFTMSVDGYNSTRVQTRTNNGGTEIVRVMEVKDGRITRIFSRAECYYREGFLQKAGEESDVLLMEPLTKGTQWKSPDGSRRYISNMKVDVKTEVGMFRALEVTTQRDQDTTRDYYAPGVGLVKTVWESASGEVISSTLSQIIKNQPLVQHIRFFYPDSNLNRLYYLEREVTFNTNDITRMVIQETFKNLPTGNIARVLTENVKMNWLYLNKDGMLYVDFSNELVSEMNAGSGYESLILASITNTLGYYYGVEKVCITIEGNPYSSGHIAMRSDEAFSVNYNDALPLQ